MGTCRRAYGLNTASVGTESLPRTHEAWSQRRGATTTTARREVRACGEKKRPGMTLVVNLIGLGPGGVVEFSRTEQ
jgi:hypothetical protein